MYGQNNRPARTQVSHYLRTGRILPAEYFENHKSNRFDYGEDDSLSHKSWTTTDFIKHYFGGNGRTVDLANIGLLDRFRNSRSVSNAVDDFIDRKIRLAKQKAVEVCHRSERANSTIKYVAFSDRNNTVTDVTLDVLRLFSVGRSTFFRSARSVLDVDCAKRTIRLEGILKFSIDDAFVDAADLDSNEPGDQEYEGGIPYKIVANWSKKIILGIRF